MKTKKDDRRGKILDIISSAKTPLSMREIASHFPASEFRNVSAMVRRMDGQALEKKGPDQSYRIKKSYFKEMVDDIEAAGESPSALSMVELWHKAYAHGAEDAPAGRLEQANIDTRTIGQNPTRAQLEWLWHSGYKAGLLT